MAVESMSLETSESAAPPRGFSLFEVLAEPENLADPYPVYAWLQRNHPVYLDPDGTAYVSRYADVHHIKSPDLRDGLSDDHASHTLRNINLSMIKAVPPKHTELRRVAAAAFDHSLLARSAASIRRVAEDLAAGISHDLRQGHVVDLHNAYSVRLTQRTSAIVFGIPDDDFDMLAPVPARMFEALYPKRTPDSSADADAASRFLYSYIEDGIRTRRFVPDAGFDRIIRAGDRTPFDDVVRLCWLLWWGSYTSIATAVTLSVLNLLENPDSAPMLRTRTSDWIEESLRFRSPHIINAANLTTRRELTIGDTVLPAGTPVRFMTGAMDRDPDAFERADVFDPTRPNRPHHVAFGGGVHTCIGAQLARMELSVALTTILDHLPPFRIAGQPTWRPYSTQRICLSLPITVEELP
ncbi:nocardicin N-oxygenase [Lentzea atacamensis]|uniref:Nocardicin N-oxygenase n=2 Tax=Lentzea TaxID=165301 RepID=A0A316HDD8_9PSEU|nr:cytochrome P450 [Lentzea atacamensis]PWK78548.1 nocardicin N-oxygenase [Lentzea atacamensis]